MRAVRMHDYGGIDVLRVEDAPVPEPAAGEVRVRVVGAAVNPVDWKIRRGYLRQDIPHRFPLVPGWDVSGVVDAVGEQATRFKVGDAVYSRPDIARDGTYAEFVVIRETELAAKPRTISHIEAASLPLAGITAYQALVDIAQVQPGQRVLVHAAAGGVGSLAVQIAKARGAQVIGTASGANRALVESLGVDQFVDYRREALAPAVREVDVVFDTLGGDVQEASWALLKPGGVLVSVVNPPPQKRAQAHGVRGEFLFIGPNATVLAELARMVEAGRLRPVIGAEFALRDIARAHELSESGRARGKIVLYVGTP
ncbi:NADP-dependent oxidoreductase [Azohydromonas caseinilytica]|uniref:NADP-dependent oxidoreductase n=1 Tax=Azohydromonas caseinilytica TaxID=2728836 RepID=A0A848FKD5_9BURK|nr:NADP-dependent oxidoreductase [Azohydromonas caseinilytica]NML18789.1 NADP-dependent oxidoreductase [Azohydromonas caseinilytica]